MKKFLLAFIDYSRENMRNTVFSLFLYGIIILFSPFIMPLSSQYIFAAIESGSLEELAKAGIGLLSILIIFFVLAYLLNSKADNKGINRSYYRSVPKVIEDYYLMPYEKVNVKFTFGDIVLRLEQGLKGILAMSAIFTRILFTGISIFALGFYIQSVNSSILWFVLIVSFVDIMILALCVYVGSKKETQWQKVESTREQLSNQVIEDMDFFQMYGYEDQQIKKYHDLHRHAWRLRKQETAIIQCWIFLGELLAVCAKSLMTIILRPIIIASEVGISILSVGYSLFDSIRNQVAEMSNNLNSLPKSLAPGKRFLAFKSYCPAPEIKPIQIPGDGKVHIEMDGVQLEIEGKPILNGINLNIHTGEKIAIVGKNGSGKSTILRSLLGMNEAKGLIRMNGVDIESTHIQVAPVVAYAPAKVQVFSEPGYSNIDMGALAEVEADQIMEAASIAGLEADLLENDANTLSGGQQQRINLARAIIKRAPLCVMDEPTASLDQKTAIHVIKNLMSQAHTLITVTHDPDLLPYFERIIVIEEGVVAFDGSLEDAEQVESYQNWLRSVK